MRQIFNEPLVEAQSLSRFFLQLLWKQNNIETHLIRSLHIQLKFQFKSDVIVKTL